MLLGLAFVCLLVGFLLLGMGAMANKYDLKLNNDVFISTVVGKCIILIKDICIIYVAFQH